MPNKFIVFEGTEGTGKTTQLNLLKEYLGRNNITNYSTTEPTKGVIGRFIKESILKGMEKINIETLQILYTADRVEHQKEIDEALKNSSIVMSDRYYATTYVFLKIAALKEELFNHIFGINKMQRLPDIWIYLRCTLDECSNSLNNRIDKTKEIFDNKEFVEKTISAYDEFFDNRENTIIIERNGKNIEEIHKEILEKLKEKNII